LGSKHSEKDRLRSLWGFDAKRVGKELRPDKEPLTQAFKDKICTANCQKMLNSTFLEEFKSSTLPFAHYYVFKNGFAQDAS
ncbi:hypothetical protein, partial [Streptomyces brasiliscabiei]|uniref:hypothetical protein n=1 Tax=Streptomyces brasiliscabiei TaxID=2736302 RepID=UPI003014870D